MKPVYEIQHNFDDFRLLEELKSQDATAYSDEKHGSYDNWKIINQTLRWAEREMQFFCNQFKLPYGSPRYYQLDANSVLLPHIDYNTTCSINHILNDEAAPVTFNDYGEFTYNTAVLDTTKMHGVNNLGKKDRYLFKISYFETTYEEIIKCLQN